MNRSVLLVSLVFGLSWFIPCAGYAEDADTSLHILRPIIQAESDKAELCLEFDHALDATNHAHIVAGVHLENEGKNIPIAPQNISIDGSNLCVLNLEHQHNYRMSVVGVRGSKGEKLLESYGLSFTVPDRHSVLSFINTTSDNGLIRWHDNDPVLRAVNLNVIHVELYRLTDLAAMGEAWHQRLQTTLAPSESVNFARDKGQLIGQEDLEIKSASNKDVEQPLKLAALKADPDPGLYLVVASAPQPEISTLGKKDSKKAIFVPMAAQWLLRSDLDIQSVRSHEGFYVLTEGNNSTKIEPELKVLIQDQNQKLLAQGVSDNNGKAFLTLDANQMDHAVTLLATNVRGEVAFSDVSQTPESSLVLPLSQAALDTDREFYAPRSPIHVTLTARDIHGHPLTLQNGVLQVQFADHSVYTTFPLSKNQPMSSTLTISAPPMKGLWYLTWLRGDGVQMAQIPLHITTDQRAPSFELVSDRSIISEEGNTTLTIRSLAHNGQVEPYVAGHILVTWIVPDTIFENLKDYSFGLPTTHQEPTSEIASFVTDEKGVARVHAVLKPTAGDQPVRAALITAAGDQASGVAEPATLKLPMIPKDYIIGIKASAPNNRFSENSLAHFSVIAVDANGKRKNVDDLSYRLFEEGRHFDWYPSEGRWDYKPLRQERRLGGGSLTLSDRDDNLIEWPVTAGDYRLEVMDADGIKLAQMSFSAGWGKAGQEPALTGLLEVTSPDPLAHVGQNTTVHFNLPKPSLITAVVADDQVRQVFHMSKPEGENSLSFIPQKDWGARLNITVQATSLGWHGHIVMPLDIAKSSDEAHPESTKGVAEPVIIEQNIPEDLFLKDKIRTTLVLKNNTSSIYRINIQTSSGITLTDTDKNNMLLSSGQRKVLSLNIRATQEGDQYIRLDLVDSHNNISHQWPIVVRQEQPQIVTVGTEKIEPRKTGSFPDVEHRVAGPTRRYIFVETGLFPHIPDKISSLLLYKPIDTKATAQWLEVFYLWQPVMESAGLASSIQADISLRNMRAQLLSRQNEDGGFAFLPLQSSDLASTTAAISALNTDKDPQAKIALDHAVGWLRHYLENGWFDERERPLRASAYAALAEAKSIDVSSLYYFADNTKECPPLAAAQLSLAFALINDKAKAEDWLSRVRKSSENSDTPETLQVLASNPLADLSDIKMRLEKLAATTSLDIIKNKTDLMSFLQSVAYIYERQGLWHAIINGNDKKIQGIWVEKVSEKPVVLHNVSDIPLYLTQATESLRTINASGLKRHIYLPNGIDVTEAKHFEQDKTYVMVIEGTLPKDSDAPFFIEDRASSIFVPTSCYLQHDTNLSDSLAWIKQLSLTPTSLCEIVDQSVHAQLHPATQNNEDLWRLAYLLKSQSSGEISMSAPRADLSN